MHCVCVHDLPLQVGEVHLVVVAQGDPTDAAGREIQRHGRTQSAGADHQRMGREQLLLAVDADLRQKDVPAVAQQLLVVQVDLVRVHLPGTYFSKPSTRRRKSKG